MTKSSCPGGEASKGSSAGRKEPPPLQPPHKRLQPASFFWEWPPAQSNYTDRRSRSASAVTFNPASDDSGCWMLCRPHDKRRKHQTRLTKKHQELFPKHWNRISKRLNLKTFSSFHVYCKRSMKQCSLQKTPRKETKSSIMQRPSVLSHDLLSKMCESIFASTGSW